MSARKRRAVGGDARSQSAPAGLESVQHSWSIHPHGRGMLATMTQGRDAAAGAHEVGGYNAAISAASYISISEPSSTVALDVRSQALPPSQVLALRLVECARMPAQQLCIVTASDTKKEIVISTLQSCDDDAAASLPLLPLLSLSLSNPSSLCCSIADGPTVVLWRKPNTTAGSECVCVQWTGQHWTMHDASLPRDSETTCCFAHSLGPSSDAATFLLSDSTGGATCIIPSLLNTSSPPEPYVSSVTRALASALLPALPCSAMPGMTARAMSRSVIAGSNESAALLHPLSRVSDCRFMCLQPRGFRSSSVIFTIRIVPPAPTSTHSLPQIPFISTPPPTSRLQTNLSSNDVNSAPLVSLVDVINLDFGAVSVGAVASVGVHVTALSRALCGPCFAVVSPSRHSHTFKFFLLQKAVAFLFLWAERRPVQACEVMCRYAG